MYRFLMVFISLLIFPVSPSIHGQDNVEDNLRLGNTIDFGFAKIKIEGISEKAKTPVNFHPPKQSGNRFIIIDTTITSIEDGTQLTSSGFMLRGNNETNYPCSGAYGKIEVFGKLSNYEATDGAVVYASSAGEHLNIFFEVPQNSFTKDLRLIYDSTAE